MKNFVLAASVLCLAGTVSAACQRGDQSCKDGNDFFAFRTRVPGRTPNPDRKTTECVNGWARGKWNTCFGRLAGCEGRPGWANKVLRGTSQTLQLYSRPKDCSGAGGTLIGEARVTFSGSYLLVSVTPGDDWEGHRALLYVGQKFLPMSNGQYDADAEKFSLRARAPDLTFRVKVSSFFMYVALRLRACPPGTVDVTPTPRPTPPRPTQPPTDCKPVARTRGAVRQGDNRLTSTEVQNGMLGWTFDDSTPTLHNMPDVLLRDRTQAYFPEQNSGVAEDTRFRVRCPENCENKPCEVVVSFYHCPPCSSGHKGKLPEELPLEGWTGGHCSPTFKYLQERHRMAGYQKRIPAGTTEVLPKTRGSLSNFAIFVRTGATDCPAITDETACKADSECAWEFGKCVDYWCPPAQRGGPPQCLPCAPTDA